MKGREKEKKMISIMDDDLMVKNVIEWHSNVIVLAGNTMTHPNPIFNSFKRSIKNAKDFIKGGATEEVWIITCDCDVGDKFATCYGSKIPFFSLRTNRKLEGFMEKKGIKVVVIDGCSSWCYVPIITKIFS